MDELEHRSEPSGPFLSVVTATRNVSATIPKLYESLCRQRYRRFEWIVMDGLSEDATLLLLRSYAAESAWVRVTAQVDFGIYDAINRGIRVARGEYYVVAGADDLFADDALQNYADSAREGAPDLVIARVIRAGQVIGGFYPRRGWIGHSKAFPVSHSVGMLFRIGLHDAFGMYSSRFPMLADGYFLKLLLNSNIRIVDKDFIAGTFGVDGVSTVRKLQTLVETWQIQMLTERSTLLQTLMFLGKLVYRYPAVAREMSRSRARPTP